MHQKNRADYVPSTPFPLPQDDHPLFIEYTGSKEADANHCGEWEERGVTSEDEAVEQRLARVAHLIAINSPPLTAGLSTANTVTAINPTTTMQTTDEPGNAISTSSKSTNVVVRDIQDTSTMGTNSSTLVSTRGSTNIGITFDILPLKMRRQIWKMTIHPRIIEFRPGGGKAPPAMNVCRESRAELRKHYEFRISVFTLEDYSDKPDFGIFVNWDLDLVKASDNSPYDYSMAHTGDLVLQVYHDHVKWGQLLRRMVVDMENDKERNSDWEDLCRASNPCDFKNLEEVLVVWNCKQITQVEQ